MGGRGQVLAGSPHPRAGGGDARALAPPHRVWERGCGFSWPRFPGERRAAPPARPPGLYGCGLCFCRPSSFWLWLFAGSALASLGSWSCSLWDGRVFLIVLMRNLLLVPARGHFIQPIGPIVSALVFPRFALRWSRACSSPVQPCRLN